MDTSSDQAGKKPLGQAIMSHHFVSSHTCSIASKLHAKSFPSCHVSTLTNSLRQSRVPVWSNFHNSLAAQWDTSHPLPPWRVRPPLSSFRQRRGRLAPPSALRYLVIASCRKSRFEEERWTGAASRKKKKTLNKKQKTWVLHTSSPSVNTLCICSSFLSRSSQFASIVSHVKGSLTKWCLKIVKDVCFAAILCTGRQTKCQGCAQGALPTCVCQSRWFGACVTWVVFTCHLCSSERFQRFSVEWARRFPSVLSSCRVSTLPTA